ncbi:IS701 family transposase [Actinoplanes sp. NPDC051411]|uniref:IS701 family transposase n=1 Tax=Actinoplanes sp. NPDC051411 TaxID=3155522 RepID=UPI0034420806
MAETVTVVDLAGWDAELRFLTDGLGCLFKRPEPRVTFTLMVRALLADVAKKNSWGLAEYAGLPTPQAFEHLLNGAKWSADELRDQLRGYVLGGLADPGGALVLDDTQAIKKGVKSVGVAPQHCGATGQVENCQCMVMLSYASLHGHAFIDRELYLPACWTDDPQRCRDAGVPSGRGLVTKPQLGIAMLARTLAVLADDPALSWKWLVADSGYGRDAGLRAFCHQQAVAYVLAVPRDLRLLDVRGRSSRVDALLADTDPQAWQQRSAGAGSKGRRYYDWAAHAVTVKGQQPAPGFTQTLLIRRAITPTVTAKHPDGIYEIEYFLVHAPAGTAITAMITAAGLRWNIEDDNKAGKDQLGLDSYQVRKWDPWHRHVTISMLAHAFLAVTRAGLGKDPSSTPTTTSPAAPAR